MTTRDIKIKVTGVQSVAGADDEPEVLELETRGTYSEKNGNRYIKYDEFIEDVEELFLGLLFSGDELDIIDEKRVCAAVFLVEKLRLVGGYRVQEFIREGFRRNIDNVDPGIILHHLVLDS